MQVIKKLTPQQEVVLDHLKCQGSITRNEGLLIHRIQDLPKRISELKAKGYKISDEWKTDVTGKRYKRYYAQPEEAIGDEEQVQC